METANQLFFDPFADEHEEKFDPITSFDKIIERYELGDIEHDYSVDKFLSDTQALMLDAHFNEQFDQLTYIASRMHALCQHDQNLHDQANEKGIFTNWQEQNAHEGHDHGDDVSSAKKKDKKASKKEKKAIRRGWFDIFWHNTDKKVKKT